MEKMSKEIVDRAKQMAEDAGQFSTSSKGNRHYIPFHPTAWSNIVKELDDDTREEYLNLADEWNNNGVPPLVQQK